MTMTAASNIRVVTKPSASVSFCRLTTGNSATAVPTHGQGVDQVEDAAPDHLGVGARADDVVRVVQHRG